MKNYYVDIYCLSLESDLNIERWKLIELKDIKSFSNPNYDRWLTEKRQKQVFFCLEK